MVVRGRVRNRGVGRRLVLGLVTMLALVAGILAPSPSVAVFCAVAAVTRTAPSDDAPLALASAREGLCEATTAVSPRARSGADRRGPVALGLPLVASVTSTMLADAPVTAPHAAAVRGPADRRHARLMVFLN